MADDPDHSDEELEQLRQTDVAVAAVIAESLEQADPEQTPPPVADEAGAGTRARD